MINDSSSDNSLTAAHVDLHTRLVKLKELLSLSGSLHNPPLDETFYRIPGDDLQWLCHITKIFSLSIARGDEIFLDLVPQLLILR